VKCGYTNYAAAYATGLLLARRLDAKLKLGYEGKKEVSGEEYHVEMEDGKKTPFKAFLDIGLHRTTTGARIFGCLKGAADGGIDIPHNSRRFPGSHIDREAKKSTYDPEVHRRRILGLHVADYMKKLEKEEPEHYKSHFSRFIAAGITGDNLSAMYVDAHKKIRENPLIPRGPLEKGNFGIRQKPKAKDFPKKRFAPHKMSVQQRKAAIKQKITRIIKKREEEWAKYGRPEKKERKRRKEKEEIAAEQKAAEPVAEGAAPAEGEAKEGEEGEEGKKEEKGKEGAKPAAGKGKEGAKPAAGKDAKGAAAPAKGGAAAPAKGGAAAPAAAAKGGKKK
jgi:large subunit ribosomal protein L5e